MLARFHVVHGRLMVGVAFARQGSVHRLTTAVCDDTARDLSICTIRNYFEIAHAQFVTEYLNLARTLALALT